MSYFKDRADAAEQLADALQHYTDEDVVILAIPRGGVPMGSIVSKRLNAPLDLLLIKKLGHPLSSELAIGAVGLKEQVITDRQDASQDYIESETRRLQNELEQQYRLFQGDRTPIDLSGKTAIIVDDGIATGSTMLAAIKILRKSMTAKIIIAVPVAPPETRDVLEQEVDEIICLETPINFQGVGQFYQSFDQVSDEEVKMILTDLHS